MQTVRRGGGKGGFAYFVPPKSLKDLPTWSFKCCASMLVGNCLLLIFYSIENEIS
jgi:hypothetical protein